MMLYQSKKMMVASALLMALVFSFALVAVLAGVVHGFLSEVEWLHVSPADWTWI